MINEDIFKHFEIEAHEIEHLIEMWKFFHPKDDPRPLGPYTVYVNDKYPEVTANQLMEVVKYDIFGDWCMRMDRFYTRAYEFRTYDQVPYLYDYFLEKHKGIQPVKEESADVKPKPRSKKDKTSGIQW